MAHLPLLNDTLRMFYHLMWFKPNKMPSETPQVYFGRRKP